MIQGPEILVTPGAYNELSTKLVEEVGFEALYISGFATASYSFRIPDIGLLTITEMLAIAKRMTYAVSVSVIADADKGKTLRVVEGIG